MKNFSLVVAIVLSASFSLPAGAREDTELMEHLCERAERAEAAGDERNANFIPEYLIQTYPYRPYGYKLRAEREFKHLDFVGAKRDADKCMEIVRIKFGNMLAQKLPSMSGGAPLRRMEPLRSVTLDRIRGVPSITAAVVYSCFNTRQTMHAPSNASGATLVRVARPIGICLWALAVCMTRRTLLIRQRRRCSRLWG